MLGLAMKLTLLRIFCIPLFIITYSLGIGTWMALVVYVIACVTDYLDGYFARKRAEVSALGAFLDPVADKLMVCAVLVAILQHNPEVWLMVCALTIIGREIWISALREWMASTGKRSAVAVVKVGKWKTTIQMFALGFLIVRESLLGISMWYVGKVLLIIAVLLTVYSMYVYNYSAYRALKQG